MSIEYPFFYLNGNVTYPFDVDAECTAIHTLNASLQCLFSQTALDCVEIVEYINYNKLAFCGSAQGNTITLFVLWLVLLFITLGVASNYFLCPALFTISNHLGLSQNVAGVTLLAFGNGSPDIFSSVAGLQKASAELAIASLVGAGMFVTCVVAGSVFLTQNFSLMIRPFLRDVFFYACAIAWTGALFSAGVDYLYHGIGFVCLYLVYIVVVLGSRLVYVNRQKQKEDTQQPQIKVEPPSPTDKSPPDLGKITYDNDPEATAVVLKAFYFGGFEWVDGGRRLSHAHIKLDERRRSRTASIFNLDGVIKNGTSSTEKLAPPVADDPGEFREFLSKLCPVNTDKWPLLPWYRRIGVLFKCPAILIMRLTVPVLDISAEDLNWNRLLICTQCVLGPIFICLVSQQAFYMLGGVPVIVPMACAGVCCAGLVFFTSGRDTLPTYHWLFPYLGFAVAVTWIYCVANEIVALLQVLGVIFNLSDAILGLTILAWGNSLSDFLSNIAVARKDFPRMAISACFGGPLLALLSGLGIPCIIEVIKGRVPAKQPLVFSGQFAFLFGSISLGLVTTTAVMSWWKFKTRRLYGVYLLALYAVFMVLALLEELGAFHLPLPKAPR